MVSFVACSGLRGGIGNVVGTLGVDEGGVGIVTASVSVDTGCCEG